MKNKFIYIITLLICNFSILSSSLPKTNYENPLVHSFLGEWIISSKGYNNDSWFSIKISVENSDESYKGILVEKGTHSLKEGTTILLFHRVGDEYWGSLTICGSADPCKIIMGTNNQKIEIKTSYGRIYSGKKISEVFHSESIDICNSKNVCSNTKSLPESSLPGISSSNSSPSFSSTNFYAPASGYGEISEKTGRAKTVHVNGYTRKDGTYVKSHYRSPPKRK